MVPALLRDGIDVDGLVLAALTVIAGRGAAGTCQARPA
jgi:hypothetical protein